MRNKTIMKITFIAVPLLFVACTPRESVPTITVSGSGEQRIETGSQSGGVHNQDIGNVEGNVVVEAASNASTCPKRTHRDFGVLERNGRIGSLCKAKISTKVKRAKCENKGGFIYQSYCVVEWQAQGSYWKVRLLKD